MKKQTPETGPEELPIIDEEAYLKAKAQEDEERAEVFKDGLSDIRYEKLSGELGSVAVLVGAIGNEVVSGARQGDEIASDRETLPAVAHHIEIESAPSDPTEIVVNTANKAASS